MSEIVAFTAEQVCRLTRLSARQLTYWDKTEFFSPTTIQGQRAFSRIYSFRDVVGLRTIGILRNDHQVPLQELRKVGAWLSDHYEAPWSRLRFALNGRRVVFFDPETGEALEAREGRQAAIEVTLQVVADDMSAAAAKLRERTKADLGKISRKRYIVRNAYVIAGTRIPTEGIWNFHRAGYDTNAILYEYPRLTAKDVRAAVTFEKGRHKAA